MKLLLFVLLLLPPAWVEAGVLTIDFEAFVDGDVLTTQLPGFEFVNTTILTAGMSLNEFEFPPVSGANAASDSGGAITISFANPVTRFAGYFTYLQPVTVTAFDGLASPVGQAVSLFSNNLGLSGELGSSPNELLEVLFSGGISSVVITGDALGGSFTLDDMTLTTADETGVPEPGSGVGSLAAVIGLVWLGWRRR